MLVAVLVAVLSAIAAAVVVLALAACAPVAQSGEVMPSNQSPYPQVKTSPHIIVVENLEYGTITGEQADVCLPVTRRRLLPRERRSSRFTTAAS